MVDIEASLGPGEQELVPVPDRPVVRDLFIFVREEPADNLRELPSVNVVLAHFLRGDDDQLGGVQVDVHLDGVGRSLVLTPHDDFLLFVELKQGQSVANQADFADVEGALDLVDVALLAEVELLKTGEGTDVPYLDHPQIVRREDHWSVFDDFQS